MQEAARSHLQQASFYRQKDLGSLPYMQHREMQQRQQDEEKAGWRLVNTRFKRDIDKDRIKGVYQSMHAEARAPVGGQLQNHKDLIAGDTID